MRIVLVAACPFPSPQGSQVFVREMAEHLAAAGHEVHLLTYGQGAAFERPGIRHHRTGRVPGDGSMRSGPSLAKPFLDLLLFFRLRAVTKRHRIELVHAHNYEAAVVALAARALTGVPVVYHSHNLMADELPHYFSGGRARRLAAMAGRTLDRQIPRRADHVVALCDWSSARLAAAGVEASRLSVIPPAIDDPGLADGPPEAGLVGYCGNLDAYQNIELLLDAFALLRQARPGVRLLIVSHHQDAAFAVRVEEAEGVELRLVRGFAEAHRVTCGCSVLVLPRRAGSGVPIKLLNYLATGRPVVAAGCGAKLLAGEADALLVADDDAPAMARAMARLLEDPDSARRIGAAGRMRYERVLGWDGALEALSVVYGRVTGGRSGSAPSTGTAEAGAARLGRGPTGLGTPNG